MKKEQRFERRACKTCMLYEEVLAGRGDCLVKRCVAGCDPVNARWCKAYVPNAESDDL